MNELPTLPQVETWGYLPKSLRGSASLRSPLFNYHTTTLPNLYNDGEVK
jgi:hypothetical protein